MKDKIDMVKRQKIIKAATSDENEKDIQKTIRDLNNIDKMEYSWNLGDIGDKRAIIPLIDALEETWLGESAENALIRIGPACIPEVIKKVEYRIENPIKQGIDHLTGSALCTIGGIRCDESIEFLNNLLDDYMSEMPDEAFDPSKRDWKYVNVDFFYILESMVRQQDKRAIPHIQKARDFFPENYVDHKVCQIAIGRIKKGHVEGFGAWLWSVSKDPADVAEIVENAGEA